MPRPERKSTAAPIAEAVGLGAAVDFLSGLGMVACERHERSLVEEACARLAEIPGLRILGPRPAERVGLVSWVMDGIHPHDVAAVLDGFGVAVRAGHHCAQPLHEKLGVHASTRASFHVYNRLSEIPVLIEGLRKVQSVFSRGA
jgi:cysteine desulfurase/selenocysteine lyase